MPAYVVVEVDIHDPERYARYKDMAPPSIYQYGGRYVARGGKCEALEGDWKPRVSPRPGASLPDGSVVLLDDDLGREVELNRGVGCHPCDAEAGCRPGHRRGGAKDRRLAVHAVAFALRLGERGQLRVRVEVDERAREADRDAK